MMFNAGPEIIAGAERGHIGDIIESNVSQYVSKKSPEEWEKIITDYYLLPLGKRIYMNAFGGLHLHELFEVKYAKLYLREHRKQIDSVASTTLTILSEHSKK